MRRLLTFLAIGLLLALPLLSGCGQKGRLTLPEPPASQDR